MTDWCIPWWHEQLAAWHRDQRPVTECETLTGATAEFPLAYFVPCPPEQLRAAAEKSLQIMKVWKPNTPLPIDAYSLARLIAAEGETASPEELVAVAGAALNESRLRKVSPTQLLLANKLKLPFYGGVEGQERWGPTDKDPTVGHMLIALFVLSGQTQHFARGGTRYIRPNAVNNDPQLFSWLGQQFASGKWGWAGHLPNVNIRRLFVLRPLNESDLEQMTLNQQGLADLRTGTNPPPPEAPCPAPGERRPREWKKLVPVGVITAVGALLAAGTSYAITEFHTKRWKDWEPPELPESPPGASVPAVPPPEQ